MGFSEAETQVLLAVRRLTVRGLPCDAESLESLGRAKFGSYKVDWSEAFGALENKGLLTRRDDTFSLTATGDECAVELSQQRPLYMYFYNQYYQSAEQSRAHGEFCRRVYGENLCQHGMMDREQMDLMLQVLRLRREQKALELGCGNGMITEKMCDLTGARVTGVDVADDAIRRARERTKNKRDRLTFDIGNINNLEYPPSSFDAIIAVDCLYFVADLAATVGQMLTLLKPGGQMAIYHDSCVEADDPGELALPETSRLGQVLKSLDLKYAAYDVTEQNKRHWRLKEQVLRELEPLFEAEGSDFLFENRMEECSSVQLDDTRFLYHVTLDAAGQS